MKVISFVKRHKLLTTFFVLTFILTIIAASFLWVMSPYYAIGYSCDAGDTISITFDKAGMACVNKAEVETPKGITVIEDMELIKDIVDCTLVAKHAGFRSIFGHYFIRLYKDDVLVRDMDLSLYNNLVRVYYPEKKHLILYGGEEGGLVFISDELLDRIGQYLEERGNSFGDVSGNYSI
jgi:hypothetical protein